MRWGRIVGVFLVLAIASLVVGLPILIGGCKPPAEKATATPIKLGYVLPTRGAGAHMGPLGDRVTRIWVEEINKKGGIKGHPIVRKRAHVST